MDLYVIASSVEHLDCDWDSICQISAEQSKVNQCPPHHAHMASVLARVWFIDGTFWMRFGISGLMINHWLGCGKPVACPNMQVFRQRNGYPDIPFGMSLERMRCTKMNFGWAFVTCWVTFTKDEPYLGNIWSLVNLKSVQKAIKIDWFWATSWLEWIGCQSGYLHGAERHFGWGYPLSTYRVIQIHNPYPLHHGCSHFKSRKVKFETGNTVQPLSSHMFTFVGSRSYQSLFFEAWQVIAWFLS